MTEPLSIEYRFDLPNGSRKALELEFNAADFRLINEVTAEPPFWTELKFNQCGNCPLNSKQSPQCPAALHMVPAVDALKELVSFDTVGVTVVQAERTIHAETSAQHAMSSVLGLIMATAGCPWTDHLRPMARFHLPFASEAETVYRSVSMYLLARHFSAAAATPSSGAATPGGFADLQTLYENLHVVNRDMSRRLGAATKTDPARNAMALLDSYTTLLPAAIDASLEDLKPLFDGWRTPKI